jgi:hypothetical protein
VLIVAFLLQQVLTAKLPDVNKTINCYVGDALQLSIMGTAGTSQPIMHATRPQHLVSPPPPAYPHLQNIMHWSMLCVSRIRLSNRCLRILTAWLMASGVRTWGPMASWTCMLSVYACTHYITKP